MINIINIYSLEYLNKVSCQTASYYKQYFIHSLSNTLPVVLD